MTFTGRIVLVVAAFLLAAAAGLNAQGPGEFVNLGPGGGGAIFNAIGSPHDPKLLFVSCDMSGTYRSTDGGKSWSMIDCKYLRSAHTCKPAFHPTDANVITMFGRNQLRMSRDKGVTWTRLSENEPWGTDTVTEFTIDPGDPNEMLAGTSAAAYASRDGGKHWDKIEGVTGGVAGFYVKRTDRPRKQVRRLVAAKDGIFCSVDAGPWNRPNAGLPWTDIRDFTGATDARTGKTVLFCTIPSKVVDGKFAGGIYHSDDLGETWKSAMGSGLNTTIGKQLYGTSDIDQYVHLAMAQDNPDVVWVTSRGTGYLPPYFRTVYRTTDGGKTWKATFWWDSRDQGTDNVEPSWLALDFNWGWGGGPNSFATNPAHPEWGFFTNNGEIFITSDAGRSWFCGNSRPARGRPAKGVAWVGRGLEVTVPHDVAFDPFDPSKIHGGWSDIGYLRSEDGGKSWTLSSSGSPWRNTFYEILPDPKRRDVIYAAASNHHGIPAWSYIDVQRTSTGGVVLSTDGGKSWKKISDDIPDTAVTSLCMDPKSPPDSRTLWVAAFRKGVYRSTDGGRTWQFKSRGLPEDNTHVYMIRRHPDGTLFVSTTGKRDGRNFLAPAGLYKSTDAGENWTGISGSLNLRWTNGFDVDPRNSDVLYLTSAAIPAGHDGGLHKTTDGGRTWRPLDVGYDRTMQGYVHAYAVLVDPRSIGDTVYLSTGTHGLFVSRDAGTSWKHVEGVPFAGVLKTVPDPREKGVIWVLTYGGGVWRGKPAE